MKFVIETGPGAHTTSGASVQAKFVGGAYDGQFLYQQKQFQIQTNWDTEKTNEKWVTTQYELPEGTQIAVIGRGQTGPRGVYKYEFHRVYRLDEAAEVIAEEVDCGLRQCPFKGRMVLVCDVLAKRKKAERIDTEKGF